VLELRTYFSQYAPPVRNLVPSNAGMYCPARYTCRRVVAPNPFAGPPSEDKGGLC
jgi:hypothetical protein